MRRFLWIFAITLLASPNLTVAQTEIEIPATQDEQRQAAILLTPIEQNAKSDVALINDMCVLQERKVQAYRLQHAPVQQVALKINDWLKDNLGVNRAAMNGFICKAPVIIATDAPTNSLIVSIASSFEGADELEKLIESFDSQPKQIEINAVIKKTVAGETVVLTSPKLICLENTVGSITTTTKDGEMTIELVARVVAAPGSMADGTSRTAEQNDAQKKYRK